VLIRLGGAMGFRVDTFFAAMLKPRRRPVRINGAILSGCRPLAHPPDRREPRRKSHRTPNGYAMEVAT